MLHSVWEDVLDTEEQEYADIALTAASFNGVLVAARTSKARRTRYGNAAATTSHLYDQCELQQTNNLFAQRLCAQLHAYMPWLHASAPAWMQEALAC